MLWLKDRFGLTDHSSADYSARTEQNIVDSDGTLLVGDVESTGSKQTLRMCQEKEKPYIINPDPGDLAQWVEVKGIEILNVAGNRESVSPGIQERTRNLIILAFRTHA